MIDTTSHFRLRVVFLLSLAAVSACRPDRTARLDLPLPFGAVDPPGRILADGTLRITGWALSKDPIETISLYVDGRYVTSAHMQQPRPEVNRAYPEFGPANCGWIMEIDGRLFPGNRELVIQVRTIHGITRDLQQTRIAIPR
jgi:hypothetical protein